MNKEEIINRMFHQKLYICDNQDIMNEQLGYLDKVFEYNSLRPSEAKKKTEILKEIFAEIGEGCYIETPFYANWGGKNVHFGNGVYVNFNLVMVDDCEIYVGNNVKFGPNVILSTGTHPIEPKLRSKQAQYNLPIHIEDNVWIGAGAVVVPGVTIGKNSVIGAGSVVTRDIPPDVVAVGSPCRVSRRISDKDKKFYYKNYEIDIE